jgi:hypothetical protein
MQSFVFLFPVTVGEWLKGMCKHCGLSEGEHRYNVFAYLQRPEKAAVSCANAALFQEFPGCESY